MITNYEFRLYPNKKQQQQMENFFGAARFIYNWGLSKKIEAYEKEKKNLTYFDLAKELTKLKRQEGYEWLYDVSNVILQQSLRHLDNAFKRFFREKKGFPKFKSKHNKKDSFTMSERNFVNYEKGIINTAKFTGRNGIKIILSREIQGKVKACTYKKTKTGKYFVYMAVESPDVSPNKPLIKSETSIGIDLGIKHFAVLSNGEKIENLKYLKNNLERLKILQKRMTRKQKGSKNREKARLKLARLYEKITWKRRDFVHKLSYKLTHESQVDTICLETLNIEGLLRNHSLSQYISDVGWGNFIELMKYKANRYGKNLLFIGQFEPSTKICSNCGFYNKDITLKFREWDCPNCGSHHDRDINAAINIKNIALQKQNLVNSGQEMPVEPVDLLPLGRGMKQEGNNFKEGEIDA